MRRLGFAVLTAAIALTALPPGAAAQSNDLELPVVFISAPEGVVDDPKRRGTMRLVNRQRQDEYNGPIGIELRGFTSQQDDPKKPYSFETRDASGDNVNVPLLGMPADDDWILVASYRDESLLRNFLAYSTARWAGRYAARTQLVEVVLNNEYQGVYLLGEDLKIHKDRLDVDDSGITGGYLLEMISVRRVEGERYFNLRFGDRPVAYKDPKRNDISYGRARWIRRYVNRFDRALYGDEFWSRQRGYRRFLDMGAAVDYMLLNELFRNADTFRNSTYMHKGADGKLELGPLWDFDHAIGNDGDAADNETSGWEYSASPWVERLYAHSRFRKRMADRWRQLRKQGLRGHIMRTIDDGASQLAGGPEERNFSRWQIFGTPRARPNDPRTGSPPANHTQAVDYLKWWLRQRIRWIDANVTNLRP
jgi:CotH kinase protein